MVNCNYVGGQNNDEYNNFIVIINEKRNPRKNCLIGLQNRILTSYNQYLNDFEMFEEPQSHLNIDYNLSISYSVVTQAETNERDSLNHCYSTRTKTFEIKRGEIFENQTKQIKAFCPYCLLNKPTTLDHYIGKTEYPEYSILLKNLIPCCYECNQKKGETWRLNNRRRYIHFYNDTFINNKFLFANLIFNGNDVPVINFQLLKPDSLTEYEYDIITWHFNDLSLLEEYADRSNAIMSTEISIIKNSYQRGDNIESIRQTVIDKFENSIGFGLNYWQNCLYEAISNNIENIININ